MKRFGVAFGFGLALAIVAVVAMGASEYKYQRGIPFRGYLSSSTLATTPLAYTLYDKEGTQITVAATDVVIVDSISIFTATAAAEALFTDIDADGAVDANEALWVSRAASTGNVNAMAFATPTYSYPGVTPKLKGGDAATESVITGVIYRGN